MEIIQKCDWMSNENFLHYCKRIMTHETTFSTTTSDPRMNRLLQKIYLSVDDEMYMKKIWRKNHNFIDPHERRQSLYIINNWIIVSITFSIRYLTLTPSTSSSAKRLSETWYFFLEKNR